MLNIEMFKIYFIWVSKMVIDADEPLIAWQPGEVSGRRREIDRSEASLRRVLRIRLQPRMGTTITGTHRNEFEQ